MCLCERETNNEDVDVCGECSLRIRNVVSDTDTALANPAIIFSVVPDLDGAITGSGGLFRGEIVYPKGRMRSESEPGRHTT